jgi:alpha-L-fucosidase
MKKLLLISLSLLILSISCNKSESESTPIVFNTSDSSLHQYNCPEWYKDAKFGIFLHWGVASEMAMCGWYSKWMYWQDADLAEKIPDWADGVYDFHVKTYGHPSKVGFKDLCPLWKAQNWNPDELVALFKKAGAKYVVPMANHHDNFDNWNSTHQAWNSVNMGPKRDIIGDWGKAIRKHGLYFGVSSHAGRCWRHNQRAYESDAVGPMKGIPYDGNMTKEDGKGKWWEGYDPQDLYCPKLKPGQNKPDKAFLEKWYKRTTELYDKYDIDLLYFDGLGYQLGETYRKVVAEFYNTNTKKRGGKCQAVVNIKRPKDKKAVVDDFEKGVAKDIRKYPWQTDTPLSTWYYFKTKTEITKPAFVIVDMLADIVSKNGNLLLNVALKGDGSLDQNQTAELVKIGQWLAINAEAIYGTRPWKIFGEGPTKAVEGHYKEFTKKDKPYSYEDIRFTTKGNDLYAIVLDVNPDGVYKIKSLAKSNKYSKQPVKKVSLLGSTAKVDWEVKNEALIINCKEVPNKNALSFKLEF